VSGKIIRLEPRRKLSGPDDDAPPPRWFPMHITEEAMETRLLSIEARGALCNIALYYFHNGGLPDDSRMVQKIADVPTRKWCAIETELKAKLFTNDWRHRRWDGVLAEMEGERRQARQAGLASAEARRRPVAADDARHVEDVDSIPF
jgi:uncharacterized protein YdaU (DUF1376 family)